MNISALYLNQNNLRTQNSVVFISSILPRISWNRAKITVWTKTSRQLLRVQFYKRINSYMSASWLSWNCWKFETFVILKVVQVFQAYTKIRREISNHWGVDKSIMLSDIGYNDTIFFITRIVLLSDEPKVLNIFAQTDIVPKFQQLIILSRN